MNALVSGLVDAPFINRGCENMLWVHDSSLTPVSVCLDLSLAVIVFITVSVSLNVAPSGAASMSWKH